MIGIVPSGGHATRMRGLHKMLLPIPQGALFEVLCARMHSAGAHPIYAAVSAETEVALKPFADYTVHLYRTNVPTMTDAVLLAREHMDIRQNVLFGMPDTYFDDTLVFHKLAAALRSGAEVAVGVFRTRSEQHIKLGMCRIEGGNVVEVVDKPVDTDLTHAWGVLAWRPVFWDFLRASDPHVGYGLPHAIQAGLDVCAIVIDGQFFDAGTPDEYFALIRHLTREQA